MTTDPIATARALIEPLTGYTPGQWTVGRDLTIGPNGCGVAVIVAANTSQAAPTDARLIAAAPDLHDMVATLADALEAERAKVAAGRLEGWRAGRDAAADLIVAMDGTHDPYVVRAIRALPEPKETSHV